MITLTSYVCGEWREGDGEPRPLYNPATEEPIAQVTTAGIDFGAVATHARQVGGPALRSAGFAQRATWLKALSKTIHEHREELIELSTQNGGNTRARRPADTRTPAAGRAPG